MPAVDVAMERSLRRGFLDLFVATLRPALERRDIQGQITDVKTAFSSWDNCMQANYCKWPAIALMIVGGLIIISVVWCIIRCACCGLSCCCSCFSCLKCCGDCCGCCDPPRGSRRKYLDEPYIPPNHGYKSQEPMHAGYAAPTAFAAPTVPAAAKGPDFPQYASFDVGGKKNEDALPQMPSWEGAERKKVLLEEEEAVEMNALKKPEAGAAAGAVAGAAAIGGPAGAASPNGPRSPANRSPYGPPDAAGPGSNGYFAASALDNDPYSQGAPAYNQPGNAYGEQDQGYGMAGAAMGSGRRPPHAYNKGGYNDGYNKAGHGQGQDYSDPARQGSYDTYGAARQQPYDRYDNYKSQDTYNTQDNYNTQDSYNAASQGYGIARHQTPHEMDTPGSHAQYGGYGADSRRSPAPQGQYGDYNTSPRRTPAPQGQFGAADPRRSPAPQGQYGAADPRRSPAPQGQSGGGGGGQYGSAYARQSPAPQGDYNNSSGGNGSGNRGYGPARGPPQRQYSSNHNNNDTTSSGGGPAPLRNDGGFDFTSGYSRPGTAGGGGAGNGGGGGGGGYRQPSPPAELIGAAAGAYPGYKPYTPGA